MGAEKGFCNGLSLREPFSFKIRYVMRRFFKNRSQKWPAKVGYAKVGNNPWYEVWNDGSFRPTPWTRILLFYRKFYDTIF